MYLYHRQMQSTVYTTVCPCAVCRASAWLCTILSNSFLPCHCSMSLPSLTCGTWVSGCSMWWLRYEAKKQCQRACVKCFRRPYSIDVCDKPLFTSRIALTWWVHRADIVDRWLTWCSTTFSTFVTGHAPWDAHVPFFPHPRQFGLDLPLKYWAALSVSCELGTIVLSLLIQCRTLLPIYNICVFVYHSIHSSFLPTSLAHVIYSLLITNVHAS